MMRDARTLLIAAWTCAAAIPAAAQQGGFELAKRGWLGFSYDAVSSLDSRAGLVIREVVDDSPAQRAGIQPGDTLLEVNGITATQMLVASLGSSLAPGDTVRLNLRRGGRTRALTLEAAERAAAYFWMDAGPIAFSPDTLRRRMRIMIDSLRVHFDTFRLPNQYIQWHGDGERSARYFMPPPFEMDSAWLRQLTIDFDSLAARFTPFEYEAYAWPGVATLGMRAVAGAELTDLTPRLARAFNTRGGVLVLRVPDRSPARRAGLAEADVIVRANDAGVGSVAELRRIIARAHDASQPARLEVLRNGRRVILVLNRR